jgi:glycosyltransferase involved in cell wall biosynthesis
MNIDVSIMCYKIDADAWYRYGYPLKMHEAFAAGKPVVSSDLIEVRAFTNYLRIAHNLEEWMTHIESSLKKSETADELRDSRIDLARRNTWDIRVSKIEEILAGRHFGP